MLNTMQSNITSGNTIFLKEFTATNRMMNSPFFQCERYSEMGQAMFMIWMTASMA